MFPSFSYEMPTRVEFGRGVALRTGEEVGRIGGTRVLLISDEGVRRAGLLDRVTESLDHASVPWDLFLDVEPNPKDRNVHAAAAAVSKSGADCLVAVGGGSPIDCAKAVAIVAAAGARSGSTRDASKPPSFPFPSLPCRLLPERRAS